MWNAQQSSFYQKWSESSKPDYKLCLFLFFCLPAHSRSAVFLASKPLLIIYWSSFVNSGERETETETERETDRQAGRQAGSVCVCVCARARAKRSLTMNGCALDRCARQASDDWHMDRRCQQQQHFCAQGWWFIVSSLIVRSRQPHRVTSGRFT